MFTSGDMTNSTVIIRDKTSGKTVAKAPILKYDKARHIITIDGKYHGFIEDPNVSMLILDKDGILECLGVVRRPDSHGTMEIAIYKGQEKENRKFTRYAVNTPAVIEQICYQGKPISFLKSVKVTVENISSSGALIEISNYALNVGYTFNLRLNISGNDTVIKTSIVRIVSADGETRKLGCQFLSMCD